MFSKKSCKNIKPNTKYWEIVPGENDSPGNIKDMIIMIDK